MKQTKLSAYFLPVLCILILGVTTSFAQSTGFTYQGSLNNSNLPATGNYDFEFKLFTASTGGTQDGTSRQVLNVPVTNGIFSTVIDFGAGAFPGADRFLEIAVRPAGGSGFTLLTPRQQITPTPYAIKSSSADQASSAINATNAQNASNSTQLGGVAANRFVQTNDSRLTDARNPLPNSTNYIQNGNTPQAASRFNISGNGTVGGTLTGDTVSATTQYNIGNDRVISSPGFNFFAGISAGASNTTGSGNAFFGTGAGNANTTGNNNSFFGVVAGINNAAGSFNSFFGSNAGRSTTLGGRNSFFGYYAGGSNTSGARNSFFGTEAGLNSTGQDNSFFGDKAGRLTTGGFRNSFFGAGAGENNTGSENVFIGGGAGNANTTGDNNTAIGAGASVSGSNTNFATAIGAGASVGSSNTIVLGRNNDTVRIAGVLSVSSISNLSEIEVISSATALKVVGGGIDIGGTIKFDFLNNGGNTNVCLSASNYLSTCSSSLRYKTDIAPFSSGLNLVNRLRPITFNWKEGGMHDLGLGAEDVAAIEPLLVTYNETGAVEGVKYDRIGVVLLNAVKEQQAQIETLTQTNLSLQNQVNKQKETNGLLQSQFDGLKKVVCNSNPGADICMKKE
jgi:Chaperone of endosialidase